MSDAAALSHLATELRALFVASGMPLASAAWECLPSQRAIEERDLPVRRWLSAALAEAPAPTQKVAAALAATERVLQWGQTYAAGDFLNDYGWAEVIGARGPLASGTHAVGVLLLGPHTLYPPHAHPAREYYVPISGVASWFSDVEDWRPVSPGDLVHHPPHVAHAMRTGAQPLLAAYCWTGEDVQTAASILDR